MLETTQNYFNKPILIKLDKCTLDKLDPDTPQLPIALHLMIMQVQASLNGDATFRTTPESLYDFILHGAKTTSQNQTTRNKVLNAIMSLEELELITIDKKTLQWNTKIEIDAHELFHKETNPYISIKSTDLGKIMRHFGFKATKPLIAYFNITSYFDWRDMIYCLEEYINKERSIAEDVFFNPELGQNWHISCYASLKTLSAKLYSDSDNVKWVTEKTLSKHLHTLEQLGLISIVTVSRTVVNGRTITMNHYCLPDYQNVVRFVANRKIEQMIYAIDNTGN